MITITFDLDNLFNLVWQRTVYLSDTIEQNPVKPEIVPINGNNRDIFNTFCKDAANKVWQKLAKYATEDSSVTEPFVLNFDATGSEDEYPNQLVYILDEPTNYIAGRHDPMITNAIQDAIVSYIIYRWMLMKGLGQEHGTQAELQSHIENLSGIDRAMTYGKRATLVYRTF